MDEESTEITTAQPINGECEKQPELKKQLNLTDGVAIILVAIIGSGIFITPIGVLEHSGSIGQSLVIWLVSGLFATFGAFSYCELGTMIPKSGANYAYIKEAYGPFPAFLFLWMTIFFLVPCYNAIGAITFAEYILNPIFAMYYHDREPSYILVRATAAVVIVLLTLVNCYSVKLVTRIQRAFATMKFVALILIVATGVWFIVSKDAKNLDPKTMFDGSKVDVGEITLALYFGLFSYGGYNSLNFVTEEMKRPYRDLPRAVFLSMPLVTIVYLLTNIAYFAVLTTKDMLQSKAVAVTFGQHTWPVLGVCIPAIVALSLFGTLNGDIFISSRLVFAGAQEGHLPQAVAKVSARYVTPIPSLILMCVTTILVLFCIGNVEALITYSLFSDALFTFVSISGLLWIRYYKNPQIYRPIKIPVLVHVIFLLVTLALIVIPCVLTPRDVVLCVPVLLAGAVVYFVTIHRPSRVLLNISASFNALVDRVFDAN